MFKFKTLERQVGGVHYKNFAIEPLDQKVTHWQPLPPQPEEQQK